MKFQTSMYQREREVARQAAVSQLETGVWLWKLNPDKMFKKWSGRFFVVKGTNAFYYQGKPGNERDELHGEIDLQKAGGLKKHVPSSIPTSGSLSNCFEFYAPVIKRCRGSKKRKTKDSRFIFQTKTKYERDIVMAYISSCSIHIRQHMAEVDDDIHIMNPVVSRAQCSPHLDSSWASRGPIKSDDQSSHRTMSPAYSSSPRCSYETMRIPSPTKPYIASKSRHDYTPVFLDEPGTPPKYTYQNASNQTHDNPCFEERGIAIGYPQGGEKQQSVVWHPLGGPLQDGGPKGLNMDWGSEPVNAMPQQTLRSLAWGM
mmetsp:Transcript_23513/g.28438  ORF Transcript_23513/g.28438 Transcript_23513/m.28438 type:complete len:315 (+) Transcript_23513:320-1264(+)